MTDFKKDIENVKKLIAEKEIERAKLEQRIEDLETQKKELNIKLKDLNIKDIKELIVAIEDLNKEILEGVNKCQKILS